MRRSFAYGTWGALLLCFPLTTVASAGRTRLCHVSNGVGETIELTNPADVQMHLAHGDVLGNCRDAAVCTAACDDHNACTVNDGVEGKSACTCSPKAVTCVQDANPCTAEVCNPASGTCASVPATEGRPCYDAASLTQHTATC